MALEAKCARGDSSKGRYVNSLQGSSVVPRMKPQEARAAEKAAETRAAARAEIAEQTPEQRAAAERAAAAARGQGCFCTIS